MTYYVYLLFFSYFKTSRRDGDSNPGYPLGVYTLSRRASSTTRASLQSTSVLKSGANYKKNANRERFQLQMYSIFCSSTAFSKFYPQENLKINKL